MRKRKLLSLLVAAMVMIGGSAWAGDKTVVSYSFDDVNSPAVTAGSRVSLDYTRTSVITSTAFLNAWNSTNGDPGASTISLGSTDLSAETWTLSFEWAAVGGCNSKADHTTLKAGDTNLFDLSGNSNWNTTVTITYAGSDGTKTLPVPGCDKSYRFKANTGDQMNTTTYWHHFVITGSSDGVKLTITNSSTGNAIVTDVVLSETNVNPTSLIIEPCCGGAIGIDELSLSYYVEGEVIQTPLAAYTKVDGINRTITATCATEGATLYYSTDGENWTEGASVIVNTSGNVYFKAVKGTSESDVLTFAAEAGTEIVLNAPTIARNANGTVTISADQSKLLLAPTATIYYTYGEENGSFTGSKELTVAADATITAYAEAEGYTKSADATRDVALFPEDANTLFSVAAATKGWSKNTFSEETITASERTYATLLLDETAWSENVLFQKDGTWGFRASGNWYINSNTANSWLLVKDAKAGNIVVVDATFAPAETVNATYTEKYSFGTKHAYIINADGNAEFALIKPTASDMDYLYGVYGYSLMNEALVVAKEALQTAIAIATNINPEGLADAIAAAQAALTAEGATAESMAQAAQTLEAAIKTYFGEVLPNLGAIVTALNEETLNTAYADAQAALAKEDVTPQELVTAMQGIITAAQAVAPAHLQNLKGYAVKYGATDAATLVDNALAAIEAGNVAQIIATMTAVKEAATPLAQTVLGTMKNYVEAFGLTEQAAQAQAALEGGNYITMITTAKALFTHLIAAAKEYLPKLGDIAEGLNDETLNTAYAAAQELLAKESITPEELGAAMQNIITAAQAVAPEHLQNLKGYAVKYGATDAATLIDAALAAIEAGNVSQIIATMTAVKEAATPLAQTVLGTMKNYVEAFGLTEQAAQAQAALEGGNYITMITTAKALFTHLIAAAKEYLPKLGDIAEGLNDETLNTAYAAAQELLAKESITPEELGAAMQNIIVAAKAVAPEHLQNLRGYAVKYGQDGTATLVDNALAAIEAGNVSQIIATMTAVKEAATPLAQTVLGTMKNYVEAFGLTEQAAQAQAALEGGNYITMITTAKALFTHLIAAAKEYLPKLGDIAEGLNDETLNTAYAAAQELLAKESITPEELGAAMQNIITAAKAVAPAHLQNLRGYAVKYGQDGTATLVDNALAAIEAGNVAQIIATMTAVKEAATPLATSILTQIIGYAQSYAGFADDVTAAQAVLEGGNYITMITTAKALYDKLIAAANDYVASAKAIPTEGKVGVDDLNAAILAAEQALAALDSDFGAINTAIANLVAAVKAFNDANKPAPAESNSYSWESPAGEVIEAGGTIAYVNGDGDRLNYKNGDYYTICLNGKKDNLDDETASANAGHMVITLDNALQEGDAIAMTAFVNKNESKKASAYIVFENGTKMEGEVYSDEANINPAFNGVPTTKVMDVPATAAGSKTITLTRSQTGTNLFITKLVIAQKSNLPTGISTVKSNDRLNGTIYNLNGQKVNMAQKGLYIVNGKKVIVK